MEVNYRLDNGFLVAKFFGGTIIWLLQFLLRRLPHRPFLAIHQDTMRLTLQRLARGRVRLSNVLRRPLWLLVL